MEDNKLAEEGQAEIGFAAYNMAFFTLMICLVGVIWLFCVWFSKLRKWFFDRFERPSPSSCAGGPSSHNTLMQIKYDVFISFRGEDTRSKFTSHLHNALCQASIKAFIDEDDLRKGDEISPALLKSIEESKLCLVILSENYADSRWCLEELRHILQCKQTERQANVLPVFYMVDPSDVRKQQGSYAVAFAKLKKRFKDEKLQAWKEALTKIANLSGWASTEFRSDSKLIETVVDVVIKRLKEMSVARDYLQGLVGVPRRIKEIESLLHIGSSGTRIVGIWGVGGIGKTTLARAILNRLASQFEGYAFLENIREESKKHEPDHFKKKLFSELLKVESLHRVTQFEMDRLCRKKILVVFDDVDDLDQWEHVFCGSWFGPESRIIVTSRDQQVLRNIEVNGTYEVMKLNYVEALELFSLHAFKGNSPTANEKKLSKRVVRYAGGIPLALKVLGRHLYSKSIKEWESTLDKLRKIPDKKIQSVLKISYDSLDDMEKEIFLDVACFFKGEDRDLVEKILDTCGLFAATGIKVLIDKALVTISHSGNSRNNTLQMHDLLQMMAFEIVRPQSTDTDGRKGTRLCRADDVYRALKYNRGIAAIEGISFNASNFNEEISLRPKIFAKMHRLRLLKISGSRVSLPQGPLPFPDTLSYLRWEEYPLKSLSTNFTGKNLVALDMPRSQLKKLWNGVVHLENLTSINLVGSKYLTQLPDLSQAPNIETVNFNFCEGLVEVPSYFQNLNKLKELNLIGCSSLRKLSNLPRNLMTLQVLTGQTRQDNWLMDGKPQSVGLKFTITPYFGADPSPLFGDERVHSNDRAVTSSTSNSELPSFELFSKLEKFPNILEPMEFIKTLRLDYAAIKELPMSINNLTGLEILSLDFCQNLEFLPDSMHSLSSLRMFSVACCQKLESLPRLSSSVLYLDARYCTSLKRVSSSMTSVKQKWDLDLYYGVGECHENSVFFGCQMLDEDAREVLMDEALLRILRCATLYLKYGYLPDEEDDPNGYLHELVKICWPGREIPRWFNHVSEGCSICISLPHPPNLWYNDSYLGFAFCVVVEFNKFQNRGLEAGLEVYCESFYMFPNGDLWRQTRLGILSYFVHEYHVFLLEEGQSNHTRSFEFKDIPVRDSKCTFMFLDNTYGDQFLVERNKKYDANWNKFPPNYELMKFGDLERSRDFLEERFGKDKKGFSRDATTYFFFRTNNENCAKIRKCGVHLLCTKEVERFSFVDFEFSGRSTLFPESEDEEGEEIYSEEYEDDEEI